MTTAFSRHPTGATVYLAAMRFEASALLRRVDGASRVKNSECLATVRGRIGNRPVRVAVCGVGAQAARQAAQRCVRMACRGACSRVVWIGIAGALSPDLKVGDLIVGRTAMAPEEPSVDLDETLVRAAVSQGCRPGMLVTVPGPVATASSREALWRRTGSLPVAAVDMESWEAARVFQSAGVPFAAVRAISDTAPDRLPSWLESASLVEGGRPLGRLVRESLSRPSTLVPLAQIRLRAVRLSARLAELAAALV